MSVDVPPGDARGVYQWEGRGYWHAFKEVRVVNHTGTMLNVALYQEREAKLDAAAQPKAAAE